MAQSNEQTNHSVEQTSAADEALQTLVSAVANISDMNTQIASAAEQQGDVAREIDSSFVTINQVARESAELTSQTNQESNDLAKLANELKSLVAQFNVSV